MAALLPWTLATDWASESSSSSSTSLDDAVISCLAAASLRTLSMVRTYFVGSVSPWPRASRGAPATSSAAPRSRNARPVACTGSPCWGKALEGYAWASGRDANVRPVHVTGNAACYALGAGFLTRNTLRFSPGPDRYLERNRPTGSAYGPRYPRPLKRAS